MLELQLEPPTDLFPEIWAWAVIHASLLWPDPKDDAERKGYLQGVIAQGLGYAEELAAGEVPKDGVSQGVPKDVVEELATEGAAILREELFAEYFNPLGGFRSFQTTARASVAALPSPETIRAWRSVGIALQIIRKMDAHHRDLRGGASIGKTRHIVVGLSKKYGLITNETYFDRAWRKYRGVSHLCVALLVVTQLRFELDFKGLSIFLMIARDYQSYITSFHPLVQGALLIPGDVIWRVPKWSEIAELPDDLRDRMVEPLSAEMLNLAREYKT